jgi:thiol:disulfide interchange protein
MKKWSMLAVAVALTATLACRRPPAATGAEEGWLTNFEQAREQARQTGRPILINFTGSDWCGWCMLLSKEVFTQPEFQSYARDNLVLLVADFPRRKRLPPEVVAQNNALQARFNVGGYPTIILIDASGAVLGQTGYRRGGAAAYVEHLRELLKGGR